MIKRIQVIFSEESWKEIESATSEANKNFDVGTISFSDVINEMVLNSRIDIKALQLKRTDVRRSLRVLAAKGDIDLDSVINTLTELRAKTKRKKPQNLTEENVNA